MALGGNQLTGPIPAALADLAALRTLDLADNQLRDAIPPALAALDGLESLLSLGDNQLTGPIPAALAGLPDLARLSLGGNPGLSGCIPLPLHDLPDHDLADVALPDCPPPPPPPPCETDGAVRDPAGNPGLVRDCTILLGLRDMLAGEGTLNWDPAIPHAAVGRRRDRWGRRGACGRSICRGAVSRAASRPTSPG